MKKLSLLIIVIGVLLSCETKQNKHTKPSSHLESMKWTGSINDSLVSGSSYLSVYSQIYSTTEHKTHDLTATVSIRNVSITDTIYIKNADYYNTKGDLIRHYINQPILSNQCKPLRLLLMKKIKKVVLAPTLFLIGMLQKIHIRLILKR